MDRNEKIKVISQAIYDDYIKKGWKNVSIYDCEVKAMNYVDTEIIVKKLTSTDVVASKRDETLELLEEIMTKVKKADIEVENGIYDPMLECAKNILNNYVIKRR